MTFEELMAATAIAHPGSPVRVRTAAGDELDVETVEIPLADLDAEKRLNDTAEGRRRDNATVWLLTASAAKARGKG